MIRKTDKLGMATALTQTKQNKTTVCRLKWLWFHVTLKGNLLLLRRLSSAADRTATGQVRRCSLVCTHSRILTLDVASKIKLHCQHYYNHSPCCNLLPCILTNVLIPFFSPTYISLLQRLSQLEELSVKTADKQLPVDCCLAERISECVVSVAFRSGDALQLQTASASAAAEWEIALNRAAGVLEAKFSDPSACRKVLGASMANHREALHKASVACAETRDLTKHQQNAALWRYEMELLTIFRLSKYVNPTNDPYLEVNHACWYAPV